MKKELEIKERSPTKSFFALVKGLKWPVGVTVIALVLSLVETVAGLAIPLITKDLVDTLSSALFSWKTAVFLFVIFVVQAITGGFSHYLLTYIGETIVADLRGKLWYKVLRLPVPYYDANETGETMSRITQDTTTLKDL